MAPLLDKLPTILVLAVLVGIFVALRHHSPSKRVRLWIFAWALIFIHFFVQLFETQTGFAEHLYESIDLAALELSGIFFLASLSTIAENRARRAAYLALLAVPTTFHALAASFDWHIRWTMAAALAAVFLSAAIYPVWIHRKISAFLAGQGALLIGSGIWAVAHQLRGSADEGVTAILTLFFGLSGVLFWRRYRRFSPGVITVSGGFLCWGAIFPIGALMDHFYPHLQVNPELWNVPKFFVAFGMILSLLEDKSLVIEEASARKQAENSLLQRFSRVTSRLLSGKDPAGLCAEIAEAVTDATEFERAAILLLGDDGNFFLAGASGVSGRDAASLRERSGQWNSSNFRELCGAGTRLGNNSFRIRATETTQLHASSNGNAADEVLVPMTSSRGADLGCMLLSGAPGGASVESLQIMKIEMLAADLAVTLENARLRRQLVRAEKLAALGQLVAGVAHELNNPLTGILGYSELLAEEVKKESAAKRVGKLGQEARRMKRIVDGLLRFARQSSPSARATNLEAVLRDAIQLREFSLSKLNIEVHTEIDPDLPEVGIGEDELKQVFMNLLNNAADAVEDSAEKSIFIKARRQGDRVVVCFEDSGPGFSDLNRAFDPFYTTKPVGKGTGLGLSICYGVIRECGGEIHLANRQPSGASVVVELPVVLEPAYVTTVA